MNFENEYINRVEDVRLRLTNPKVQKRIDKFLSDLAEEFKCDFRLSYEIYPESDDYDERLESEEFSVPRDTPTMTLSTFTNHISNEKGEFKVYIDPIYLQPGLNEINDVLTTVVNEDCILIIPVSHNKKIKL